MSLSESVAVASAAAGLRAHSDPVIFRDDRVLRTLLRKEAKYLPSCPNYFQVGNKLATLIIRCSLTLSDTAISGYTDRDKVPHEERGG